VTCTRFPVVYIGMKERNSFAAPIYEMKRSSQAEILDDTNA
jgi:hypothetical protein